MTVKEAFLGLETILRTENDNYAEMRRKSKSLLVQSKNHENKRAINLTMEANNNYHYDNFLKYVTKININPAPHIEEKPKIMIPYLNSFYKKMHKKSKSPQLNKKFKDFLDSNLKDPFLPQKIQENVQKKTILKVTNYYIRTPQKKTSNNNQNSFHNKNKSSQK